MTKVITSPSVHQFDSTGSAYDASQCDDNIKDGDVLVVASEGVIGILMKAWPCAVVFDPDSGPGALHVFADTVDITAIDKRPRDEHTYPWTNPETGETKIVSYVIEEDPGTDYSASVKLALETAESDADITGNDHWREPKWHVQHADDEGYAVKEFGR